MFPLLRSAINMLRTRSVAHNLTSSFHVLSKPNLLANGPFLAPLVSNIVPQCGLKVVGKPRRRCKDCFMVWREQRLYVLCKTHPRHKQVSMAKKPKNTWILTHATQGKIRPW